MLLRPDLGILSLRTKAASMKISWPSLTTCATWPSWSTWSTSPCDPALTWASFPAQICEFLQKMCLISNAHNSALRRPICIISTPVARLFPQLQPLFSTPSSQMSLNTLKRPKTGRRNCSVLC